MIKTSYFDIRRFGQSVVSGHKHFRTVYFPIDFYVNLVFSLISPKFEFSTNFEFFSLVFPENYKV